jgi:hypothetical protein
VSARENLFDRKYVPTEPFDSNDIPRFSQLRETSKDVFSKELTEFFNYKTNDFLTQKKIEIPNVQKFAVGASSSENSLETVVNLIQNFGDTPDKFPMVAITSSATIEKKLGIGSNFVDHVQYPASVVGTNTGPFDLSNEDESSDEDLQLVIKTWPNGYIDGILNEDESLTSTLVFAPTIFNDITNISAQELVDRINSTQALYYKLSLTGDGYIRISAGGVMGSKWSTYIEVLDTSSAKVLNQLGFTIGQSDAYTDYTNNKLSNRYSVSADITINVDVVTDELNTRTELADLVFHFFAFYMEKRKFQFIGRSYQDRDLTPEEWYHIILKNQFSWSGETEIPRTGASYDMIYAVRGTIPITIIDYINRNFVEEPAFLIRKSINEDQVIRDDGSTSIPDGDYFKP